MANLKYSVRKMTRDEVPQALDIWREEGYQQGINSLYSWLEVDPEAFSIAVTDDGEVIGACSGIVLREDLAFVGFYCVRKKYRGLGVGQKVWAACMERIGDRNVCLNAVPDKVELYSNKCDFPIVETDWVCNINLTKSPVHPEKLSDTPPAGVEIVPLQDVYLPLVFAYDRNLIGFDRRRAIELSSKEPDAHAFVALKEGSCVGFGIVKLNIQGGSQVGPLYADDNQTAEVILKKLILSLPQDEGFVMMTCSCNGPANEMVERIGCPTVEEDSRLYRKKKVDVDKRKIVAHYDLNFEPY